MPSAVSADRSAQAVDLGKTLHCRPASPPPKAGKDAWARPSKPSCGRVGTTCRGFERSIAFQGSSGRGLSWCPISRAYARRRRRRDQQQPSLWDPRSCRSRPSPTLDLKADGAPQWRTVHCRPTSVARAQRCGGGGHCRPRRLSRGKSRSSRQRQSQPRTNP